MGGGEGRARAVRATVSWGRWLEPSLVECTLDAKGRWRPLGSGPSRLRCTCPSSSSRPPCLLFLGLSLCIFWAAIVRGCLAKSSDALQSTCQLQQQGNELERKTERVREGMLGEHFCPGGHWNLTHQGTSLCPATTQVPDKAETFNWGGSAETGPPSIKEDVTRG